MDEQITADKLIRFLMVSPDELKQKFIDELSEKMKGWECTIDIYSDKDTVSEIAQAEKDFAEGKGIEWVPGTYVRGFTNDLVSDENDQCKSTPERKKSEAE